MGDLSTESDLFQITVGWTGIDENEKGRWCKIIKSIRKRSVYSIICIYISIYNLTRNKSNMRLNGPAISTTALKLTKNYWSVTCALK